MWQIMLCGPLLTWQCSVRSLRTIPELIIRLTVKDGGSSVSVVNRQRTEQLGGVVEFPVGGGDFSFRRSFKTGFGSRSAFCLMVTGRDLHGVEAAGA